MLPEKLGDSDKKIFNHADCFKGSPPELVRAYFQPNDILGMHMHEFYEINIITQGHGRHYIGDGYVPAQTGNVFVIPPRVKHGYAAQKTLEILHILISYAFINQFSDQLRSLKGYHMLFEIEPYFRAANSLPIRILLSLSQLEVLGPIFKLLCNKSNTQNEQYSKCFLALYIITRLCDSVNIDKDSKSNNTCRAYDEILKAMEYIHHRLSYKIELKDLCDICHMSSSALVRNFKKVLKCTPAQYITRCRLEKAVSLIESSQLSLTSIAQECGFYDSAHFNKLFTRCYGVKPKDYINKRSE